MSSTTGWWRRNRWWLPAAPVTLTAMIAASSLRIGPLWWEEDFHRAGQEVPAGEWADVRDDGHDAIGEFERHFRVRLESVTDVEPYEPSSSSRVTEVPAGARVVSAHLEFEADPDEVLSGCTVVFVGSDGTEYGGDRFDPLGQGNLCVPLEHPGPSAALFESDTERAVVPGEERPEAWSTDPLMIVPEDATITQVQIRYEPPDHLVLLAPE